jgi:hypothetical protein
MMTKKMQKNAKSYSSVVVAYRQGLFNHKKRCNFDLSVPENTVIDKKKMLE